MANEQELPSWTKTEPLTIEELAMIENDKWLNQQHGIIKVMTDTVRALLAEKAAQAEEIKRLVLSTGEHITVRSELRARVDRLEGALTSIEAELLRRTEETKKHDGHGVAFADGIYIAYRNSHAWVKDTIAALTSDGELK